MVVKTVVQESLDEIRISALNESFSDGNSKSQSRTTTKEAKEAEAFALYNKALGLQRQGETTRAEALFKELLHHPFMQEAVRLVNEDGQEAIHPGLQVLYSTHKNMATIALQRDDTTAAIESLLEALVVDGTEVTVWYRVGTLAMKLSKYSLARFSFEQGLQCNPRHWPCLDSVITVLYVLNDYWHCLSYIATALERDSGYSKGLMIRRQIYSEHAALKKDTEEFFRLCDPAIFLMEVDQKETDEFVAEALAMRQKRRELAKVKPPTPVKLPTLADYSWRSLGRSLVALYDYITQSNPPKSLALRIDVSAYGPEAQKSEKDSERPSVAALESEKVSTNPTQPQPETPMDVETPSPEGNQSVPSNLAVDKPVGVGDLDTCQNPSSTAVSEHQPPVSITSSQATPTADVPAADPTTSTEQLSGKDNEKSAEDGQPELPMETEEGAGTGVPAEVALHDHCAAMDPNDLGAGSRKGAKRKRLQLEGATKRRSARVRNTNKKKEDETVNFQDLLQKFLPSSLLQVDETEEEDGEFGTGQSADDTTTKIDTHTVTGEEPQSDLPLITATEEADVREFLLQQQKNGGLILMMKKYLYFLSERDNMKWSENLKSTYMEVYGRARHHIRYPDCPDSDEPDPGVKSSAKMCLVYNELKLDQWLSRKVKFSPSPGPPTGSPRKSSPSSLLLSADFPGKQFTDDMWFLCTILGYSQILEEFWAEHAARVYWLKGRFSILTNQLQDAVDFLNMAQFYAKLAAEEDQKPQIRLFQCQVDNVISQEHVAKQLESLERCTALEEIQQCYDNKEYQRVVDCLLPTFRQPLAKQQRREGANIPQRQSQLLLLQDSLFKLKDLKKCLLWGEEILSEAVQHYRHAFGSTREEWGATLTQIFAGINKCISQEEDVIGSLPASSLVRLTQNLVRIIELLMDTPDFVTEVPVDTVLPWIVLYKLISHEEKKLHSLSVADGEECLDGAVTSSFMLLNVAHEYLGRRSWCTQSDGMLLKFFLGVLRAELEKSLEGKSALYEEEINQAFEQCSYCLFGYPNKKSRVKHLQDHGCQQIPLTWNKAVDLFEYFKPKTVPEFDSYKTSTVSGELQGLLKRISSLVPEKYRAGSTVDQVQAYVEGSTTGPPMALAEKCGDAPVVRELYYLLADYYFKNKEQAKAVKFYMLDLCYNPWRVDSWAGLALARMSKLQQKLSSHELKMDMPILKQSISPLRCFRRAVETDDTNSKLWIEYGCLAYELHSHASRQIKLNTHFPVAEDMLKLSRTTRTDMLKIAGNCYRMANQCESDGNEEEWLHHYMMGKVAEKQRKPASEYLKHYRLAAMHTHEDNAVYPRKITYVVSPPHLACEALEVFYRLHAASLKLLLKHSTEVDYGVVEGYLTEAAQTPFALSREKRRESSRESQSSGSDAELLMGQPGTPIRKRHNYHTNPQDHNYSRQKSRESGSATEGSVSGAESVDPLTSAVSATLHSMVSKVARNLDGESSEVKEHGLLKNNDNKSQVPGQKPKASFLMADILANTGRNKKGESVPEINKGDNPSQQFKGDNPKEIYIKIDSDSCDEYSSATSSRRSATTSESETKDANNKTVSSTQSATVLKNESESEKKDGWKTILVKTEIESGDKNKQQAMDTDGANNKNAVSSDLKKPVDGQNLGTTKDEKKDYGPPGFKNPKHKELMDKCVAGLSLCLSRFPQHYKSLYRLSHLYLHSPLHKNLEFARDLLLGNLNWQQLRHMPAPGLFADRKSTDFFKGVWRIPIDEIDRSGSFRSHLARSVQLVLDVLREQKDASTLFHVHHQLSRVPDLGKKYMRDAERVFFARQAFVFSLDAMETQLGEVNKVPARDRDPLVHLSFLIEVYRLWNYGVNKMSGLVDRVNDLFAKAFRIICADRVDKTRPVLEQALLFCQEQLTLARVQVQTVGSPRSSGMSPRALFSSPSYDRAQDYPTIYHREHKGEISTKAVATPVTAHQPTPTTTPNKSESKLKAVSGLQKPDTNVLDLSVAKNPTSDTKKSSSNVASAAPVSKMPLVTSFIKAAVADSGKKRIEIPVKKQPTVSTVVKQQPASGVGGVSLLRKNQLVSSTKSASQVVTPRTEHPVVFSSAANKPVPSLAALREEAGKKADSGNKNLLERLVKLPNADSSSAKALSSSQQNIPTQTKQLPKPPIQNPQSLSLSGKKLPLPVAKPVQQPPLTNVTPQITDQSEPACIILSDSEESSHSSLMEFTIELNDSDFDEPIIITTSDWNS